jgi:hypothetical protein
MVWCDTIYQWIATYWWLHPGTSVSFKSTFIKSNLFSLLFRNVFFLYNFMMFVVVINHFSILFIIAYSSLTTRLCIYLNDGMKMCCFRSLLNQAVQVGNTDVMFIEVKSTVRLRSRDSQTSTLSHALCSSLSVLQYLWGEEQHFFLYSYKVISLQRWSLQ